MLPALMAKRLPEVGIDHAMVYGTLGLSVTVIPDDDLRKLRHYFNHAVKGREGKAWKGYYDARECLP